VNKEELLNELIGSGALRTPELIEAFQKIDRRKFVLEEYEAEAYGNFPLPIGYGQTTSQPFTVAFMLEALNPAVGEKILEIGTGSGWQTAILAEMVGDEGKVTGIERIPELKKMSEANLDEYSFVEDEKVVLVVADGSKGAPQELVPPGGFDKIIAAASGKNIPEEWKSQLKIGGRIVAPVENKVVVVDKISEKDYKMTEYPGFAFVPLIED